MSQFSFFKLRVVCSEETDLDAMGEKNQCFQGVQPHTPSIHPQRLLIHCATTACGLCWQGSSAIPLPRVQIWNAFLESASEAASDDMHLTPKCEPPGVLLC